MGKSRANGTAEDGGVKEIIEHELQRMKQHWWWFLVLGVLLLVGGIVGLSYPLVTSLGVVLVLGTVLIIAGVATVIGAFWAGK